MRQNRNIICHNSQLKTANETNFSTENNKIYGRTNYATL